MKYIRVTMENYSILFEETIPNFDLSPYENDYMFEYDSIINWLMTDNEKWLADQCLELIGDKNKGTT